MCLPLDISAQNQGSCLWSCTVRNPKDLNWSSAILCGFGHSVYLKKKGRSNFFKFYCFSSGLESCATHYTQHKSTYCKINPLAALRAVISMMRQCSSPSNISECSEVKFASSSNTQVLLTLEFHHLSILNMIRMTRPHDTYLNVTLFLKSSTLECS